MNYVPGCVSLLFGILFWQSLVCLCAGGMLYFLCRIDDALAVCNKARLCRAWLFFGLLTGVGIGNCLRGNGMSEGLAYGCLAVYLILCSVMDTLLEMVCDFFHYIGVFGGGLLLVLENPSPQHMWALIFFVGVQGILFFRMYGPADVAVFVVCAMYLTAKGGGMLEYVMHMGITFLFLGVVQGLRGNINAKGNLKRPVALIPYITVGFFVIFRG